jgi:hypothetical protein
MTSNIHIKNMARARYDTNSITETERHGISRPRIASATGTIIAMAVTVTLGWSFARIAGADSPSLDPDTPASADLRMTDAELRSTAKAGANTDQTGDASGGGDSGECAAFAADPDADVGDIVRAGCKPTTAQMSKLMDNPLGNVAMLWNQFDYIRLKNPANDETAYKGNYMGIAQFPKGLGKDWNLINRVIWNVPSMPLDQGKIDRADQLYASALGGAVLPPGTGGPAPIDLFDGRTTGFGDMYYVGLFSPKKPIELDGGGKVVWGLGFDLAAPTASDEILGTGKWSAGPSAIGVYLGPKWKIGALGQQYWDFAGDSDRDGVNMTNLQYFYYYSLNPTTSIGAAPNIIANWQQDGGNRFTVPIGLGINKTFQIGSVPVRFGAEVHYSVVQPDTVAGAEWNFRFFVIPSAPSALFKWMQ